MNKLRIITVFCIIFLSSAVLIPFANADWIMFRSDPSNSGAGTGNPVFTPTLLWKYTSPYFELYGPLGWQNDTSAFESCPAVVNGIVYIGAWPSNVYAFNATNGSQLWSYAIDGPIYSCPAVVNGIVYVGGGGYNSYNVYALNANSNAQIWNYTTGGYVWSSPAVVNGVVYVGSYDDNVYALNASSGAKLWNYTTGGYVWSSPAVVDGASLHRIIGR